MKRPIRDGFFLVWRHQRLVWWIFFVNLVLGFLGSTGLRVLLRSVLDKSLYAKQLSQQFDVTVYLELLIKPEVSVRPLDADSAAVAFLFLIYTQFISGGVLSVYRDDRKLGRGEFFEACGDFFWRMVRLLLCSVIPFGIVLALFSGVQVVSGKMSANTPREMQGFWVAVVGFFICVLFALFVRAWFDVAQARTVCERVRGMFVLTFRSFVLALRNLPRLVSIYFAIALIGALLVVGVWFVWLNIPHQSFGTSWLLLEVLSLLMVGLRLWQRAASLLWYENYTESHVAVVPLAPWPLPEVIIEEQPVLVAPTGLA
jgi:hypothetical protein